MLLTVIRKTIGQVHPTIENTRIERAWISQKLFMTCCNLSGRSVSNAIDSLVLRNLLEVTNIKGDVLNSKSKRRGASKLYYTSLLRLEGNRKQASEVACYNPVTKGHTIKLNKIKQSCYNRSQGVKRISDNERFLQIQEQLKYRATNDTT